MGGRQPLNSHVLNVNSSWVLPISRGPACRHQGNWWRAWDVMVLQTCLRNKWKVPEALSANSCREPINNNLEPLMEWAYSFQRVIWYQLAVSHWQLLRALDSDSIQNDEVRIRLLDSGLYLFTWLKWHFSFSSVLLPSFSKGSDSER